MKNRIIAILSLSLVLIIGFFIYLEKAKISKRLHLNSVIENDQHTTAIPTMTKEEMKESSDTMVNYLSTQLRKRDDIIAGMKENICYKTKVISKEIFHHDTTIIHDTTKIFVPANIPIYTISDSLKNKWMSITGIKIGNTNWELTVKGIDTIIVHVGTMKYGTWKLINLIPGFWRPVVPTFTAENKNPYIKPQFVKAIEMEK